MSWGRRFLNMFRGNRLSRDLDRELEFHIAERADELRSQGLSAEAAERQARRRLGNYVLQKERTRDVNVIAWLDTVRADVQYAARSLLASPAFSLVAVLSLALGIGANTAIFSLMDALVLKSLPVERPEELVQLGLTDQNMSWPNPLWEQVRDRQQIFTGLAAYSEEQFDLSQGGIARPVPGSYVSGQFFTMLGVRPEAGRLLGADDDYRGCAPVAVLGAGFWHSEFGGARDIVGRSLLLSGKRFEIVGVADAAFAGVTVGRQVGVYVPLCAEAVIAGPRSGLDQRSRWFLQVLGRPQPGTTQAGINAHLAAIAGPSYEATLPEHYPPEHQAEYLAGTISAVPAAAGASTVRDQYRKALLVLMGLVAVVLLIACANVANLLLARATARRQEIAVRLAIGAGRARIMRQLMTESLLLAMLGALFGVMIAVWASRALVHLISTTSNTVFLELPLDLRLLGFTLLVATAAALVFGVAPAWRAGREDPQNALRASARGVVSGHSRFNAGKALVVGQIALSLGMLVAAGLLLGTFRTLWTASPGFDRERVMLVAVDLPDEMDTFERQRAVYGPLLAQLRALPGVESAGTAELTPVGRARWNNLIFVDGHDVAAEPDRLSNMNQVSDGYFATLGTRVLYGREFSAGDIAGATQVAVVNEEFARYFFGVPNVVGRSFRFGNTDAAPVEIVGVVENTKYQSLREEPQRIGYLAWNQATDRSFLVNFVIRIRGDEPAIREAVVAAAERIEPAVSLRFGSLERQLSDSLARERMLATLSAFFGGLALLLAMIGLYGIMAYTVTRRRGEIGIRIALGSARARVLRMVLGEAATLLAAGLALGAAGAIAGARLVESFLYGVQPRDPLTIVAAALLLGAVGLTACALPAWRASRVEPMTALRND
jgi:putative ABC transport system permease protein